MINTFSMVLQFLINTFGTLFLIAVLLRLLLQRARADFYNPICQMLVKITNPLLIPLRRIIPGLAGWDTASIVLALIVQVVILMLIAGVVGFPINGYILVVALVRLAGLVLHIYFFAILLRAVASWLNPNPYSPAMMLLIQLTEPVLAFTRRYIPSAGGLDFSPLIVLILIQVILIMLRQFM